MFTVASPEIDTAWAKLRASICSLVGNEQHALHSYSQAMCMRVQCAGFTVRWAVATDSCTTWT